MCCSHTHTHTHKIPIVNMCFCAQEVVSCLRSLPFRVPSNRHKNNHNRQKKVQADWEKVTMIFLRSCEHTHVCLNEHDHNRQRACVRLHARSGRQSCVNEQTNTSATEESCMRVGPFVMTECGTFMTHNIFVRGHRCPVVGPAGLTFGVRACLYCV